MGFVWHVALRYFRSTRADAHIRVLSSLTAGGLAVGTAALVLALAALSGFQNHLLADLARHTPALQLELAGSGARAADNAGEESAALVAWAAATNGVAEVQELLYARGWLAVGASVEQVEVLAFENAPPVWIPVEDRAVRGLIVPMAVAQKLGLAVGETVRVFSPRPGLTPLGPRPRTRTLPVAGIYRSDRADYEELPVLLPLGEAAALFASGDRRLDITLAPEAEPEQVAGFLREAVDPAHATVIGWREANRALLFVLRLEKSLVFSAVVLIVAVAAFALLASLSLVLSSKRSEVGALAAMGAPPARLQRIFLALGALLSVGGACLGGALGAGVATFLDRFRVISLPADVYIVEYVPFLVRGSDVLIVVASTVVFTGAASLLSARRASRLDPVEAMRSART